MHRFLNLTLGVGLKGGGGRVNRGAQRGRVTFMAPTRPAVTSAASRAAASMEGALT